MAPSSWLLAAIFSCGVRAPPRAARAAVTESITCCSWVAKPFTVFTRFGIRSARRCSATSTCDQAAAIASFWTASSLRTETNFPANIRPTSSRIPKTTRNIFIVISLFEAIDGIDNHGNLLQIGPQKGLRIQVAGLNPFFTQIEQAFKGGCIEVEDLAGLIDHLALLHFGFVAVQHECVAEQNTERGNRIG